MRAKLRAGPGRCAAWSLKGVHARLRGLWRNDAKQTPISGLPEIGTQICASRVNPTCVDRWDHRLRDGPDQRCTASLSLALHRIRDTSHLILAPMGLDPRVHHFSPGLMRREMDLQVK